jgi:carboxyl-terminal processing protease
MVRTSRALIAGTVAAIVVGLLAFASGWVTARIVGFTPIDTFISSLSSQRAQQETPADVREEFAVFWQVWELVDSEFYHEQPLEDQQIVYGAIRGMLGALEDEYTTFQEPDVAAQSRESMQGKFEGIGAYLRVQDGEIAIDKPFRESPAERAGLRSGDVVVAIDGVALGPLIEGLDDNAATAKAAAQIRGPKGTLVTLTIRRPPSSETFDLAITRDEVPIISVNAELLDGGVAYIQITEFKATTTQLLDQALRELVPQNPTSVVLDLRNNPGGYLTTAQEVLGRFYEGVALYEEERDGVVKELRTISAPDDTRLFDLPMVVLINGGSASAAEIVAGALRDERPNTTLLGETSFGKGSVQNIHQLRDGSSARITIARWLTPDRDAIHRLGITPEYEVVASEEPQFTVPCVAEKQPPAGLASCSDAQLSWGLSLLQGSAPPPPAASNGAAPPSEPKPAAA